MIGATRTAKCFGGYVGEISCFDDILSAMTKMSKPERKLVQEVQTISKLLAGNLLSSTAGEPSF